TGEIPGASSTILATSPVSRIQALVALGYLRARRGDPEVAKVLDEALALATPTGELQRLGPVRAVRAEAAWLAGDSAMSATEASAGYDLAISIQDAWLAGQLAYCLWRSGSLDHAPAYVAEPYRLQIDGNWAAAAELWRQLGCPYEEAQALAESDDPDALRRSLQIFEDLGARPMTARVTRRLHELGVRGIPRGPRPTTRANAAGLTRRESEVLELVAQGLRNGEIAEHLYLSPKTVDHHVSSVLAKLEASSRMEAVSRALELGIISR
ncbi:MAG TPA: response regulator transcription factor, partial [Thermomicrobiales bacterium]|nr:response regulator transcription factor [Thermomicrobiales bacterium]